MAERSDAKHRRARRKAAVTGSKEIVFKYDKTDLEIYGTGHMEPIDLEPRYSTTQIPGKCLKCLAEQQLDSCLRQLLIEQGDSKQLQARYTSILSFLMSPESKKLRNETEKYLAEGKNVKVKITSQGDEIEYIIEVTDKQTKKEEIR